MEQLNSKLEENGYENLEEVEEILKKKIEEYEKLQSNPKVSQQKLTSVKEEMEEL